MAGKQGQAGTQGQETIVVDRDDLIRVLTEEISDFAAVYLYDVITLSRFEVQHIVGGILQRLDQAQSGRCKERTACRPASWYGTSPVNSRGDIGVYFAEEGRVIRYRLPVASAEHLGASVVDAVAAYRRGGD